ncbi:MAG: hypothetical protein ACW964_09880 [Candidatus Hodarchaeales archaeon]|jgi:hypothetical protein
MNPNRATRILAEEIINQFNMPYLQSYEFIRYRIKWAMGIGYDMGRQTCNTGKMVVQMFSNGKIKEIYITGLEAGRKTGIDQRSISKCCRGKYKTAGGYRWKFLDPQDFYERMSVKDKKRS